MDFSESQVNIVIFSVDKSSCKGHTFWLNIAEFIINMFFHNNVKSGHIIIYWKPNNIYFKICGIPVI